MLQSEFFQQRFESFTKVSSRAINEALFLGLLPRFVFEVAIYISLGLVFITYALKGTPLTHVVGEFAVFGAAAMRLLPSVSKVVSHLQSLKHARPAVVAVTDYLYISEQNGVGEGADLIAFKNGVAFTVNFITAAYRLHRTAQVWRDRLRGFVER